MSTILFDQIVFGPIHSRRLGTSLGINLLPLDGKLCSFDCIYCECGYNSQGGGTSGIASPASLHEALEQKFKTLQQEGIVPDVITFAGNGEPTLHPHFPEIIEDTIRLRDQYFPQARISVLSNGTRVGDEAVYRALLKVDNNILKLDSAIEKTLRLINAPNSTSYSLTETIERYASFGGKMILQTLFTRGTHKGEVVDNTTAEELEAWLQAVQRIKPWEVMIYTIDRETPEKSLTKVPLQELRKIARRVEALGLGISTSVAG